VRLHGQPIHVLAVLLESAGSLVTREELRARLWPADTFVDFDHGLHSAIARLREALNDSAEKPRYIETLPRRGYRFIGKIEEDHASTFASPNGGPDVLTNGGGSTHEAATRDRAAPRRRLLAAVTACVILLASFAAWQRAHARAAAVNARTLRSIAVLPLENLSGDQTQDYFADGMTEELITELSRIRSLKVISRTSVMAYKGSKKRLPEIARELGVDGIVEGSVARDARQVRVTVQLLDGPDDRHLWSEAYRRPLGGILDLQAEIATAIARQVSTKVGTGADARPAHSVDPEAYETYLRGRYYLNARYSTFESLNRAKTYFDSSIRTDPAFAAPYAALADTYLFMASFRHVSPQEAYSSATRAIREGLELDDRLSEAHAVLGNLYWQYSRDWPATEKEFELAIALDPNYDSVRACYSGYLAWRNRRADALAQVLKARELNPGSSYDSVESAVYFQLREYQNLVEAGRRGIRSEPGEWLEHFFLGVGYEGLGRPQEAIPEFETAVRMSGGDQDPTAALAHAYAVTGRRVEAGRILNDLILKSKSSYGSPYMIAVIHAGLGDKDKAFELLDNAVTERSMDVVWQLKADPRIDNLRSDPRFQRLWARAGFPPADN
jgi:TolB-like protein/DNA-binding winged helix-turn-helix (wHTH) protein/tetratricopeptide (TPR) repeat protein